MTVRQHRIKVWPSQFLPTFDGRKRHEWRKNDRDFAVGDELVLEEFDPHRKEYTGRVLTGRITWITEGFGVPDGWCVMTIATPQLSYDCPSCGENEPEVEDDVVRCAQCGCELGPQT